ncbi:MAG: filamentous hemagglutinin N-terminal domain-containing protein, partial [Azoarcus sp.]|nr:filamentous hemagglutinin N-terminal domain-containing protein [Azoarcus sp.]
MTTSRTPGMRHGKPSFPSKASKSAQGRAFRLAPIARAVALAFVAGVGWDAAHAQQAFSPAWFATKGAVQSQAAATGLMPNGQPASSFNGAQPLSRAASAQVQQSIAHFNTAAQAIAMQQRLQQQAREAAWLSAPSVPDGLVEGGLKIDENDLTKGWRNAKAPTESVADGKTTVAIEQTAEKAILNWETFNVGRNTTVNFDQSAGTDASGRNEWIALNRVNDPAARPSQIQGQIKADGSVYIINRNGVVFTGTSQVNTRGLVASTLSLSDEQFERGINNAVNYPDAWNSGNNTARPIFGDQTPVNSTAAASAWTPPIEDAPGGVTVEAGAELTVSDGGKLMLFGTQVENAGALSVADGQVILAAGEQVWLTTDYLVDTSGSSSATFPDAARGLDVAVSGPLPHLYSFEYVRKMLSGAGGGQILPAMEARAEALDYHVTNSGSISAERGNVTLQSREVNQNGVVFATTALNNLNGSIRLRGWGQGAMFYAFNFFGDDTPQKMANWSAGTVTLGEGSVTLILPDAGDTAEIETTLLATRYTPSRITVDGKLIDLQAGSLLMAPSGEIELIAAASPMDVLINNGNSNNPQAGPASEPVSGALTNDGSRIYIDSGAVVSVAGLQGVDVAMDRNFVEVDLRINELRDSPLLADSWL